jgi:uncharacterized membrane protein
MKIQLDTADKISEVVSLLFIAAGIFLVAFALPGLPDKVPVHFDLKGEPNRFGSKYELWIGVGASVMLYMLFSLISSKPHLYNYPSRKNDLESQYKLGSKMMRSLKAWMLLFLFVVNYIIVQSAHTHSAKGALWLIAFVLAIVAGHLIYFYTQWKKIR